VIVLVIVGVFLWRYFGSYESTDDAQIDGHVGSISARVSGHIVKVNIQDNQYVDAGTVLAEIDPTDYQVAVNGRSRLRRRQSSGRCRVRRCTITSVNTTSQLSSADAEVRSAQAGIRLPGSSTRLLRPSATGRGEQPKGAERSGALQTIGR